MPGAVRCVAGAAYGRLAVVAGVTTETALVNAALGRAVERQAHLFQVQHSVDGFLGHHLGGVLVHQVVPALDRVEGMPFPVVFFDIGQRCTHSALRGPGVRAGGVKLRQYSRPCALTGFDGRAHTGTTGADNNDVVLVNLHAWCSFC